MSGSGGNRQDNRQRGNAAQLLEKYKSMARDSQLAGDRVQTEYYLQFADHYFRVLSESRVRFDEQRRGRDDDGDGDDDQHEEMADADSDTEGESNADERPQRRRGRDREDRFEGRDRQDRGNGRARDEHVEESSGERIAFDVLPPAIGAEDGEPAAPADSDEDAPRPRRRARRPRADDSGDGVAPAA
jgi:hypothetical protein